MKLVLIVTLIACTNFSGLLPEMFAQDYIPVFSRDYSSRLSLEIDPLTYIYNGHSIHVRYQPMFSERFLIGIGTYALDLPQALVDINSSNRNEGWKVRIRSAYFLYGELFATEANHGWFIGEQIGFQSFKVSNNREFAGSTAFNNLLLMTYAGYSWYPWKRSFYLKPWIGLGYTDKVDGINKVRGMVYEVGPLFPFFTLHTGYTF